MSVTVYFHEVTAGDARKLTNESADAVTGGGARDLRQNEEECAFLLRRGIFTELSSRRSNSGQVFKAPGLNLHYFPPQPARPNETRMSVISDVRGWIGAEEGNILILYRQDGRDAGAYFIDSGEFSEGIAPINRRVWQTVLAERQRGERVVGVFTLDADLYGQEEPSAIEPPKTIFDPTMGSGAFVTAVKDIFVPPTEEFDLESALEEEVGYEVALRRSRPGQTPFRNALIRAYGPRCLVTGTVVEEVIEAAHIIDAGGEETMHPRNGLLLRRDIHRLWDLGLLKINPSTLEIEVDSNLDGEYTHLGGGRLLVDGIEPDRAALKWKYNQ
mgnify:CR=1 FL=1